MGIKKSTPHTARRRALWIPDSIWYQIQAAAENLGVSAGSYLRIAAVERLERENLVSAAHIMLDALHTAARILARDGITAQLGLTHCDNEVEEIHAAILAAEGEHALDYLKDAGVKIGRQS